MIVTVIGKKRINRLILPPNEITGNYTLIDQGSGKRLLNIEGNDGKWEIKSNYHCKVVNKQNINIIDGSIKIRNDGNEFLNKAILKSNSFNFVVNGNEIYNEFKGLLTEQFVLQELSDFDKIKSIYYWSNESLSKVDFVFNYKNLIIPVEAKSGINVKAQSLKNFMQEYNTELALRFSLLNLIKNNKILNIPLYIMWNTIKYIDEN